VCRELEFTSSFPNEWTFNALGCPVGPGARELAEAIAAGLSNAGMRVGGIDQWEYYGWAFEVHFDRCCFLNVLNPVDKCYLTISLQWYWLHWLLARQPRLSFDRYLKQMTDVLAGIPEISGIKSVKSC
jgi:hypothetical protein